MIWKIFFFFQAEDGIRDLTVTGVQTCALPILTRAYVEQDLHDIRPRQRRPAENDRVVGGQLALVQLLQVRSEERRVGKSVAVGARRVSTDIKTQYYSSLLHTGYV